MSDQDALNTMSQVASKFGVSGSEAISALHVMAQAAREVPFPEGLELRHTLLMAWRRDYGLIRLLRIRWWILLLSTG